MLITYPSSSADRLVGVHILSDTESKYRLNALFAQRKPIILAYYSVSRVHPTATYIPVSISDDLQIHSIQISALYQ
jgi:hypothetical protein